jgi:hypothetical protein
VNSLILNLLVLKYIFLNPTTCFPYVLIKILHIYIDTSNKL